MIDDFFGMYSWHPKKEIAGMLDPSFERFVDRMTSELPGHYAAMCEQYTRDCSFIGRTETLADDMHRLFGRDMRVPYVNQSRQLKPALDKELAAKIKQSEAQVMQLYYLDNEDNRWKEDWK